MTAAPPREVVLTADPSEIDGGGPGPDVQVLAVTTAAHLDLLGALHGGVPDGGGAVLAVLGVRAVATAGWTAVEHGTSEIVGVLTTSTERRRGIGAAVVSAAVDAAARAGADLVWLRTHDAGALRLYRALGFEPTGSRP